MISAVNAADSDNETLQQTIEQPDEKVCLINSDSHDELEACNDINQKLEKCNSNEEKIEASPSNMPILESTYHDSITSGKTAKTKVTLKSSNVKMYYHDGSELTITIKNKSKKPISNAKIKITIDDKSYTKTTNSKGKASLKLNLDAGKYTAKIQYMGSDKYYPQLIKSKITVKTTINSKGLIKFYKNSAPFSSTFLTKKGKILKNTNVKFRLNGKTHIVKTDKKGVAKLPVDLKPGLYAITSINPKTSQTQTSTILIKTLLETHDLTMTEDDGSKFCVKVLDSNGKGTPNKKVTLKVNSKTYRLKSDAKGIASQAIDLPYGAYDIITEYDGLIHTNKIIINKKIIHSSFSHITSIPDYVNVTAPYVFSDSKYAMKTGKDGILKLPKIDVFAVHISETESYVFSTMPLSNADSITLDYKTYLVPFDGSGIRSDYNKNNLKGDGILISKITDFTQIEFRSTTHLDADMFGLTFDKHNDDVEIATYIQNDLIKARIIFLTARFDEIGLKTHLGKFYGKNAYEINFSPYDKLTNNNIDKIRFTNTNQTLVYDLTKNLILPVIPKENIITRFIVNNVEELEKSETITFGHSDSYQPMRGFEVLQSYALINGKVTKATLEKWLKISSAYLSRIGIMNVYGMYLSSLETAWLADEIADEYSVEFDVNWRRNRSTTILGGINLKDTYIHILNADMGMKVTGDSQNVKLFKTANSFYLPYIESYALAPIAENYGDNSTNSLDDIIKSMENNKFSISQIGEMFYITSEDGGNSTIVINSTSGISSVIYIDDEFAYKGSLISTSCDCCSVGQTPVNIIKGIENTFGQMTRAAGDIGNNVLNKIHPLSVLGYMVGNLGAGIVGKFISGCVVLGLASTVGLIMGVHGVGNYVKNNFVDKKNWHWAYEHVTFTRDGYMQNKKFFNIPKSDGTYDYVEVGINSDGSLNRNDALYVGDGYTKKLTKSETYKYFTEEKWTACSIPRKYQKYEVPLIFG